MVSKQLLKPILNDDAVTRGLADPEARILVEWLVTQAEFLSINQPTNPHAVACVDRLCRRARAISRFVSLWSNPGSRGAAFQLAATERFAWPLPTGEVEPCELMLEILSYEVVS